MFRALILGRDSLAAQAIQELTVDAGDISCVRAFSGVPSSYEFIQLVQSYDVNLLLVDLSVGPGSRAAIQQFRQRPHAIVIGFASEAEQSDAHSGRSESLKRTPARLGRSRLSTGSSPSPSRSPGRGLSKPVCVSAR